MSSLTLLRPTPPRLARRAAFGQIVLNEARLTLRRPVTLVMGAVLPVLLLVIFSAIPTFRTAQASLGGVSPLELYVPILIGFGLGMQTLLGLPIPLVSYRELGILRRLSTTPVPPSWLLAAQGVVQGCIALAASTVIIAIGIIAFGVPAPKSPGGLVLSFLLSVAGLFPIGLVIASLARTSGGANVIGRLAFFPLMFFAGLWWPRALMPPVLRDISNFTPIGAAVQAIQDPILKGFPSAWPLLVLTAYALVFGFLAKRFFRWE